MHEGDVVTWDEVRASRAAARRRLFERTIPTRYTEASLDDLDDQQPGQQVRGWLASDSPTLFLVGGVGTGKTHAGYAVLRAASDQGMSVAGAPLLGLLDTLRPNADHSPLPRWADDADLFMFDDVGTERPTDWAAEQFDQIVDGRTREGLRQIITTNLSAAQLAEQFGTRVVSRLSGGAVVAQFAGPDRREVSW